MLLRTSDVGFEAKSLHYSKNSTADKFMPLLDRHTPLCFILLLFFIFLFIISVSFQEVFVLDLI